jgi:hypothetical protein
MLLCQKCGYDNELGRIFCHQCGTKLDLDAIKPESRGGKSLKTKKGRLTGGKLIRHGVELAFLLFLVYAVYLMLTTPAIPSKVSDAAINTAEKKFIRLEQAASGKKEAIIEVTLAELNGYLSSVQGAKTTVKWGFVADRMWAEFRPKAVTFHLLLDMHVGELFSRKVSISWTGQPKIEAGAIKFIGDTAQVGELTWPSALVDFLGFHSRTFSQIAGKMSREQEVLSRMSRIDIQADRAVITYKPQ